MFCIIIRIETGNYHEVIAAMLQLTNELLCVYFYFLEFQSVHHLLFRVLK